MTLFFKRLAVGLGAALAALALLLALGLSAILLRPDLAKPLVERSLSAAGVQAELGQFELALNPLSVKIGRAKLILEDKTQINLDHLSASFSLSDLIWGRPWIEQVDVQGLSLKTAPAGPEESPSLDISPIGWIFLAKKAEVREADLSLPLYGGQLEIKNLDLSLTPAKAKARQMHLAFKAAFHDAKNQLLAAGEFVTQGLVQPGPRLRGRMDLKQARAALPGGAIPLMAQANFELNQEKLTLHALNLSVGRMASAQGQFEMKFQEGMAGHFNGRILQMQKALSLAKDNLPKHFADLKVKGELPFRLDLTKGQGRDQIDLTLNTDKIQIDWQGLKARLGGDVKLAKGTPDPWLLGGTLGAQGRLTSGPFGVRAFKATLPLSGNLESPRCQGLDLNLPANALSYQGRKLALGKVRVSGDAALNNENLSLEGVKILAAGLGQLEGKGRLADGQPYAELRGNALKFTGLVRLLKSAGLPLADLNGQGLMDIKAEIKPGAKAPRLLARLDIKGLSLSANHGLVMGQNLAGRLQGNVLLTDQPKLQVDIDMPKGEALWGTVFLDFSQNPIKLKAQGIMAGSGRWRGIDITGRLGSFGSLAASGELLNAQGTLTYKGGLNISDAGLGPIFATFVREPLSASRPDLAGLHLTGQAHLNLKVNRTTAKTNLQGSLRLIGGGLAQDKETLLQGLDLKLPISYILGGVSPKNSPAPAPGQWGLLLLERLRLGGMDLGPFDLPITLLPNRLYLGRGVDIPLWGGRLQLSEIRVDEPLSALFKARFKARLSGLDLGRAPTGSIKLKGNLDGRLSPVVLSRQRLETKGALKGGMFKGNLKITNINIERPFTPGREIAADLVMKNMDMGELSQALDIGSITGAVDISVKGLRLAYGQPVAFDLRVESMEESDREQKVSLKAVNSISILGTGSGLTGLGVDLLKYFFQEFPYEKIGFRCTLNNDVFRIKGLIKDGEEEYIVKKPLFTGINVINRSGDNQINFSDMLKRLKRVTSKETRH